ncbi:DKK1 protein, partial [Chroicocephalus maculipennis]|nr:DKK1 protein [Chroicocephalus maculipennis]NXW99169.1 DKK1 protein [Larus smithsonianus]
GTDGHRHPGGVRGRGCRGSHAWLTAIPLAPAGLCTPPEPPHGATELDEMGTEALPRRTPAPAWLPTAKGEEGDFCLRSSDCSAGLCCARHFWSKICKPVLREGQVCTRHRRKGTHGLEIFQRCQCAEGLACRLQREHGPADASRLHTCQRH